MARTDLVKQRLENWARWCQQLESGALGYPKQSAFVRMAPSSGSRDDGVPVRSLEASETDDAVKSLQFTQSHLYQVVLLTYAKGLPRYRVAQEMRRAESTVSANLSAAYAALERWFDAREVLKAKRAQDAKNLSCST